MTHTAEFKILSHQMHLLLEVGQAINSVLDLDRLLDLIAQKATDLLEAERCTIFVVDRDHGILWTQTAVGEARFEIPLGTGIAGAVVESAEVINVADAYQDPRFNQDVDRRTGFRTRSLLAGPMYNQGGEIIGVCQLINSLNGHFSGTDERLLSALSGFVGNALEKAQLYEQLKSTFLSVLEVLAATIDTKHPYTAGHTNRVAEYSCGIAQLMGLPEEDIEQLRVAAYLHDYGKIGIRDAVLTKPGRLTDDEYAEMKSHVVKTQEILSRMRFEKQHRLVPSIAGAHHERWDGNGYPNGLKGEAIPLGARIMAIADVFDALTSDRDYRKAMPFEDALNLLRADIGSAFDPRVFPYFEAYFKTRFQGPGPH
jgi:HD-GYP domain-containing protein (c-di-GMP phosphodiesterase class II)